MPHYVSKSATTLGGRIIGGGGAVGDLLGDSSQAQGGAVPHSESAYLSVVFCCSRYEILMTSTVLSITKSLVCYPLRVVLVWILAVATVLFTLFPF